MRSAFRYLIGLPVVGIIRGINEEQLLPTIEAVLKGGLTTLEITMNTPRADVLINKALIEFGSSLQIGAGTVTSPDILSQALSVGATFIVTPTYCPEIILSCKKASIPVICGALTPTEIFNAWQTGATMIKVFPVKSLGGAEYIKELRGPFADIPLLACGGVNYDNLEAYAKAGTTAIAVGSQLFKPEWIESKQFEQITNATKKIVTATTLLF